MFRVLTSSFLAALCASALGCASQASEDQSVTATPSFENFRDARISLAGFASEHSSTVMNREDLPNVTLDEVRFHDQSIGALDEMEWSLHLMAACRTPGSGVLLSTSDALAAVKDLRNELSNHKIGMLTMIDFNTARAAEMVFEQRQALLLDELEAYRLEFSVVADQYDCAF